MQDNEFSIHSNEKQIQVHEFLLSNCNCFFIEPLRKVNLSIFLSLYVLLDSELFPIPYVYSNIPEKTGSVVSA